MGWLGFNPYFIGLPILMRKKLYFTYLNIWWFQSLFYWITYSYNKERLWLRKISRRFQSLFYWITYSYDISIQIIRRWKLVSILILLDYLFLFSVILFFTIIPNKVSILILLDYLFLLVSNTKERDDEFQVSILILLDYLFLLYL